MIDYSKLSVVLTIAFGIADEETLLKVVINNEKFESLTKNQILELIKCADITFVDLDIRDKQRRRAKRYSIRERRK